MENVIKLYNKVDSEVTSMLSATIEVTKKIWLLLYLFEPEI